MPWPQGLRQPRKHEDTKKAVAFFSSAAELLNLRRGRRSRPVETRSVDRGVYLYLGQFRCRLAVRPGGDRLERHLDARDLAIPGEIVLCGNAANSGIGET